MVVFSLVPLRNEQFELGVGRNLGASSAVCSSNALRGLRLPRWVFKKACLRFRFGPQPATGRGRAFTAGRPPARHPRVRCVAAGTLGCGPRTEGRRRCQRCNLNIWRHGPTSRREGKLSSKAAPVGTLPTCAGVPCCPGGHYPGDKARYLIATSRLLRSN